MKPNGMISNTVQPSWATSEQMLDEVGDDQVQWLVKAGFKPIRLEENKLSPYQQCVPWAFMAMNKP
jgi:hypothetical protein